MRMASHTGLCIFVLYALKVVLYYSSVWPLPRVMTCPCGWLPMAGIVFGEFLFNICQTKVSLSAFLDCSHPLLVLPSERMINPPFPSPFYPAERAVLLSLLPFPRSGVLDLFHKTKQKTPTKEKCPIATGGGDSLGFLNSNFSFCFIFLCFSTPTLAAGLPYLCFATCKIATIISSRLP